MLEFKAKEVSYSIVLANDESNPVFPYIKDNDGTLTMQCVSPIHGRSFVLSHDDEKWVIGKGNGLNFTNMPYIQTTKEFTETWGGLSLSNAKRDFWIGNEVSNLGILTNRMEYVLELDFDMLKNGNHEKAALLQYSVKCPYRISDYGFIPKEMMCKAVESWKNLATNKYEHNYLIATEVLIRNLSIMHSNNIMHNALHVQNYTWALELLDFEASRSDNHPYDCLEYEQNAAYLFDMEIIQTYEVINYIAWCLGEQVDYSKVDGMFRDCGFEINKLY